MALLMPVSAVSTAEPVQPTQTLPTVILAGCGYGAIAAMQALSGRARVIGINPYPYIVNSGMSTRLISGRFDSDLVRIPLLEQVTRYGAEYVQGRVTQINPEEQQLEVKTSEGSQWLRYDYLLLNVGRELATHGIPGVQDHAFGVRPMGDLVRAHQHVRDCWRRAAAEDLRPGLLTFVVAGGGCTGVELIGELGDLCHELSHETGIPMSRARLILVAGDRPLVAGLSPRFGEQVEQSLLGQGIEVWRPCRVQAVEADAIQVRWSQDGREEQIPCLTTLWAGGLQVAQWLSQTGLPLAADGSIRVEATLRVQGSQSILAMGDCAYFERDPGIMLPKIGVYAVRQAPIVAQNLVNLIDHQPLISYLPQKSAFVSVTIGNKVAVMEKGSLVLKGYFVTVLKNLFDWLYMRSLKPARWQDFFY
jgi:NADH dehydrogenase FAD-containing subunit